MIDRVHEAMRRLDPAAAERMMHHALPGGHFGASMRSPRTKAADAFQHTDVAGLARHLVAFAERPVPRRLAQTWRLYTTAVLRANERVAEQPFQKMIAGKYVHDRYLRGIGASEKAIEQAARGLMNTPEQEAMLRFVQRVYGQYSHFSPAGRRAKEFMPFYAWAMNSVRLLGVVLPKDHPVLTALMARSPRRLRGLAQAARPRPVPGQRCFAGVAAGKLAARRRRAPRPQPLHADGARRRPVRHRRASVLPQLDAALKGWQGMDWKGAKLRHDDGSEYDPLEAGWYGLRQLLLGVTPAAPAVERFAGADGDLLHRARKVVDPFMSFAPEDARPCS